MLNEDQPVAMTLRPDVRLDVVVVAVPFERHTGAQHYHEKRKR